MKQIWIIGAGSIAQEYAKVLNALGYEYEVIGRGINSANSFQEKTDHSVIIGGLKQFLKTTSTIPSQAIIATPVSELSTNVIDLLNHGVRSILVEKPGFLYPDELNEVAALVKEKKANVYLAYNRRYYSSVLAAQKIIEEDGGVKSFLFEFTEWGHVIEKLNKPKEVLGNWFFANSSHVVDLAFFLGGKPVELSSYTADELSWYKPAIFSGAGITDKGALFSYQANWKAPGRWGVELLTSKHRLYLRPMEQVYIQDIGSVAINPVKIDDYLDKEFKPGFYLETKNFLEGNYERLCSIEEQLTNLDYYRKILSPNISLCHNL